SSDYAPTTFTNIIVYEFYMPLAHEGALRTTLDSLFYRDAIEPRLRRIGIPKLTAAGLFEKLLTESDEEFFEKVLKFVEQKFGGYSIYHVDGRFRATGLLSQQQAVELYKTGERYLVDETTAVTRFIFPVAEPEAKRVRFLFEELFM